MCKKFALGFIAATLVCSSAIAQEVTLRAVTAFAEKTTYSRGFEKFIERVNAEGKGKIQINYIGGPKAMPPFEVGKALQGGVIDIANTTGAFTTNVMPEGDAWKLTEKPMSELRKNGGYDYMAKLYAEKMNAIFLARLVDNNPFHLYLTKPNKMSSKARPAVNRWNCIAYRCTSVSSQSQKSGQSTGRSLKLRTSRCTTQTDALGQYGDIAIFTR